MTKKKPLPFTDDDLYVDCAKCETTGIVGNLLSVGQGKCPDCDGRGIKFTDMGHSFLRLMKLATSSINRKRS